MNFQCLKIDSSGACLFESSMGSFFANPIGFKPEVLKNYCLEFDFHDVFCKEINLFMAAEMNKAKLDQSIKEAFSTLLNSEKTYAKIFGEYNFILGTLSQLDEDFVSAFSFLETVCLISLEPGQYPTGQYILMTKKASVYNVEY